MPSPRVLYLPDPEHPRPIAHRVAAALRVSLGPEVLVGLRLPHASVREIASLVGLVAPIVRDAGARLVISARVDLALACGADGVHLPALGLPTEAARTLLPRPALLGRSCHDRAELEAATGADYVTLSPVREVPGKGIPLGVEGFGALAATSPAPVLALGGVDPALVRTLVAHGAHGVAVRRAIDDAGDPAAQLHRFLVACRATVSG